MPPTPGYLDDDVDVYLLGEDEKFDLLTRISMDLNPESNKYAILDAFELGRNLCTWVAVPPWELKEEGEGARVAGLIEVPAISGKRPRAYFLYGGSLVMYRADLG